MFGFPGRVCVPDGGGCEEAERGAWAPWSVPSVGYGNRPLLASPFPSAEVAGRHRGVRKARAAAHAWLPAAGQAAPHRGCLGRTGLPAPVRLPDGHARCRGRNDPVRWGTPTPSTCIAVTVHPLGRQVSWGLILRGSLTRTRLPCPDPHARSW